MRLWAALGCAAVALAAGGGDAGGGRSAVPCDCVPDLFSLDVRTGEQTELLDTSSDTGAWLLYDVSPDRRRIAFGYAGADGYELGTASPRGGACG